MDNKLVQASLHFSIVVNHKELHDVTIIIISSNQQTDRHSIDKEGSTEK